MKFTVAMIKKQNEGSIAMWEREVNKDNKLAIFKLQLCLILKATLMQLEDDHVMTNEELSLIDSMMNSNTLEEAFKVSYELTKEEW